MTGHRALEKKQITQGNNRKVQNPSGSPNVGVLGSSPKRITKESESYTKVTLFFYALNAPVYMVQLNRELNQEWIFRISFPKYSWRISLSLQLPLESSKHLCPHALTANITS